MLYSIGHSNQTLEAFFALLKRFEIRLLVDVRTAPRSGFVPQFDKVVLENKLPEQMIKYRYMGDILGGRPDGAEYYDAEGRVLYYKLAKASFFVNGLDDLTILAENQTTAIMCSEENPSVCHRHLLIGHLLFERQIDLQHIRGNGTIETFSQLVAAEESAHPEREQQDLFGNARELEWKSLRSVLRENRPPNSSDF